MKSVIRAMVLDTVSPASRVSVTTRAPALISGLRGTPCSRSSWTIELNAEPDGSWPTRRQRSAPLRPSAIARVNTFDMLWMENGVCASPAKAVAPSTVATAMPNCRPSTLASAGM